MAVGLLVGVVAIFVGAWALGRWRPFADDDHHPAAWPENVEELAFFVERTTGIGFARPLDVEFIADDADYAARVEAAWGEASPDAETLARMARVTFPESDPVTGSGGALARLWLK